MPYLVAFKSSNIQIAMADDFLTADEFENGFFMNSPVLAGVNMNGDRTVIQTSEIAFITRVSSEKYAEMKEREKKFREQMNAMPPEIALPRFHIPRKPQ